MGMEEGRAVGSALEIELEQGKKWLWAEGLGAPVDFPRGFSHGWDG